MQPLMIRKPKVFTGESISASATSGYFPNCKPYALKLNGATLQDVVPTPNAASVIKRVMSGTKIGVCGKNLFSQNLITGYISYITGVYNTNRSHRTTDDYIQIITGETYILSDTTGHTQMDVAFYNNANTFITSLRLLNGGNIRNINTPFNIPVNGTKIKVTIYNVGVFGDTGVIEPVLQLERGSTATVYEPYTDGGEVTVPCDLYEGDTCTWLGDRIEVVHTKAKKEFDGTENWNYDSLRNGFYCPITNKSNGTSFYCSNFEYNADNIIEDGNCHADSSNNVMFGYDSAAGIVANWESFLATRNTLHIPVIIVYDIAELTTDIFDAQPLPRSDNGTNTIYQIAATGGINGNITATLLTVGG